MQGTVVDAAEEEKKKSMPMTVEMAKDVLVGQVGNEDNKPNSPTENGMHAQPVQFESNQVDNE